MIYDVSHRDRGRCLLRGKAFGHAHRCQTGARGWVEFRDINTDDPAVRAYMDKHNDLPVRRLYGRVEFQRDQ